MLELTLTDVERLAPEIEVIGIDNKVLAYRFKSGDYESIAYTYSGIKFNVIDVTKNEIIPEYSPADIDPDDPRYALQLSFEYVIFENPNNIEIESSEFKVCIGNILIKVIEGSY